MPEVSLDFPRQWIEFVDPADDSQTIRADLTWLTSRWTCIFGSGCKGIYSSRPDDGCCTLGAHFSDKDDLKRVRKAAERLTAEDWQLRDVGLRKGIDVRDEDGQRKTRVVDGACVFLNRPGSEQGSGCALHALAAREGTSFVETKPEVCWQLPMRRSYDRVKREDGTETLVISLTEFDRRAWGPGGHDLDWYCSGNTEAHVGREPVYISNRDEIVALIGQPAYDVLVGFCDERERSSTVIAAHPADPPRKGARGGR